MPIAPVPELVAELAAGRMVILVDEEDRENEGDLVLAAEHVTPEAINFMARHARGLICLTLTRERCERLQLPLMAPKNGTRHGTAFTVSIEAATGVSTGISAADRARTVAVAVARDAQPGDLVQPGHVFPLMAQDGGVLMRAGHTEAGCDLTRLAGLEPAAVICEVMKDDGTMARLPDLVEFAREHRLKIGTISDLITHRARHETLIERHGTRMIETAHGRFDAVVYRDRGGGTHLALKHGRWGASDVVPVRVHEPFTAIDLLDLSGLGHSWPLPRALQALHNAPCGVAVLLNCSGDAQVLWSQLLPGRGGAAGPVGATGATGATGVAGAAGAACAAVAANAAGAAGGWAAGAPSGSQMDLRLYGVGAQILRDLGVRRMELLGHPRRMPSMAGYGLEITGFRPAAA